MLRLIKVPLVRRFFSSLKASRPEIASQWPRQTRLKTPGCSTANEAVHDELSPDQSRRPWHIGQVSFSRRPCKQNTKYFVNNWKLSLFTSKAATATRKFLETSTFRHKFKTPALTFMKLVVGAERAKQIFWVFFFGFFWQFLDILEFFGISNSILESKSRPNLCGMWLERSRRAYTKYTAFQWVWWFRSNRFFSIDFPIYVYGDNGFNCNSASEFSVNYTKIDG
jgi:hypothetical protein